VIEQVHVTFKVTRDGEAGHAMDHVMTTVAVGPDGEADEAAIALVADRMRREIRAKAAGGGVR
jgi:hypothetical protein